MPLDRWVVIDDSDPVISYDKAWFSYLPGTAGNLGNIGSELGSPYLDTLHSTLVNGSASLQFNGTAIEAWGAIAGGFRELDWQCFVDEVKISGRDIIIGEYNRKLCGQAGFPDGIHNFRIEATKSSSSADITFWLDQIRYIPSPNSRLDNKVLLLKNTDSALQFNTSAGWKTLKVSEEILPNITNTKGPVVQITFTGVSISWFGLVPASSPKRSAEGTWSVDGGEETQFAISGPPSASNLSILNQQYFTTPDYPAGVHNLSVVYLGDNTTVPLCLDYLYVKNGSFPVDSRGPPNTDDGRGTTRGTPVGAIVGGVLGGLALLLCLAGAGLLYRHRQRRHGPGSGMEYTIPTQFILPQSGHQDASLNIPRNVGHPPGDPSQDAPPRYTKH